MAKNLLEETDLNLVDISKASGFIDHLVQLSRYDDIDRLQTVPPVLANLGVDPVWTEDQEGAYLTGEPGNAIHDSIESILYETGEIANPNTDTIVKNNGFYTIYYLVRRSLFVGDPYNVENILEKVLGESYEALAKSILEPQYIEGPEGEEENSEFLPFQIEINIASLGQPPDIRLIQEADFFAFVSKYPHVFETGQFRIDTIAMLEETGSTIIDSGEIDNDLPPITPATGVIEPEEEIGTHFIVPGALTRKGLRAILRKGYVKSTTANSKLKEGFDTVVLPEEEGAPSIFTLDQKEFKGASAKVLGTLVHHAQVQVLAEGFGKNAIFSHVKVLSNPEGGTLENNGVGYIDSRVLRRFKSYIDNMKSMTTELPSSNFVFETELPRVEVPEPNEKYSPPDWTTLWECEPFLNEKTNEYCIVVSSGNKPMSGTDSIKASAVSKLLRYYDKKSNITPNTGVAASVSIVDKLLTLSDGLFARVVDTWSSDREGGEIKYLIAVPRTYFDHPSLDVNEFRVTVPTLQELTAGKGSDGQFISYWWIVKTNKIEKSINKTKKIIEKKFKKRIEAAKKDNYALEPELKINEEAESLGKALPAIKEFLKLNNEKFRADSPDVIAFGFGKSYRLKTVIFQKDEEGKVISRYLRKGLRCFAGDMPFSKPSTCAYMRFGEELEKSSKSNKYPGLELVAKYTYPSPGIVLNEEEEETQLGEEKKTVEPEDESPAPAPEEDNHYKTKQQVQEENTVLVDPEKKKQKFNQRKNVSTPNVDSIISDIESISDKLSDPDNVYDIVLNKVDFKEYANAAKTCLSKFVPNVDLAALAQKQALKSLGFGKIKSLLSDFNFTSLLQEKGVDISILDQINVSIQETEQEHEFYSEGEIYSDLEMSGISEQPNPDGIQNFDQSGGEIINLNGIQMPTNQAISPHKPGDDLTAGASFDMSNSIENVHKKEQLESQMTANIMDQISTSGIEDSILSTLADLPNLVPEIKLPDLSVSVEIKPLKEISNAFSKFSDFSSESNIDNKFSVKIEPPTVTIPEISGGHDDPLVSVDEALETAFEAIITSVVGVVKNVIDEFIDLCDDVDLSDLFNNLNNENKRNDNLSKALPPSGVPGHTSDLSDQQKLDMKNFMTPPTSLDGMQSNRPGSLDIYRLLRDPSLDVSIMNNILNKMDTIPTNLLTSEALDMLDYLSKFLRPSEICSLLLGTAGKGLYEITFRAIHQSTFNNVKNIFVDTNSVKNFFKALGKFIDLSFCSDIVSKMTTLTTFCEDKLQDDWYCKQLAKKGFSQEECEDIIAKNLDRNKDRLEKLNDILQDGVIPKSNPILCGSGLGSSEGGLLNPPYMQQVMDEGFDFFIENISTTFDMELRGAKELFVDNVTTPGASDKCREPEAGRDFQSYDPLKDDSYNCAKLPPHLAILSPEELFSLYNSQTEMPTPSGIEFVGTLDKYLITKDDLPDGHEGINTSIKPSGWRVDYSKQNNKSWPKADAIIRTVNNKLQTSLKLDNSNILSAGSVNVEPTTFDGYGANTDITFGVAKGKRPAKEHFTMIDNHKLMEYKMSTIQPLSVTYDIDRTTYSDYYLNVIQAIANKYADDTEPDDNLNPITDSTYYGLELPNFDDDLPGSVIVSVDNPTDVPFAPDIITSGFKALISSYEGAEQLFNLPGPDFDFPFPSSDLYEYVYNKYGNQIGKFLFFFPDMWNYDGAQGLAPPLQAWQETVVGDDPVGTSTYKLPFLTPASNIYVNKYKQSIEQTSKLAEVVYPSYLHLRPKEFIFALHPDMPESLSKQYVNMPFDYFTFNLYSYPIASNMGTNTSENNTSGNTVEINTDLRLGLSKEWLEWISDMRDDTAHINDESGLDINQLYDARRLCLQQYMTSKAFSLSLPETPYTDIDKFDQGEHGAAMSTPESALHHHGIRREKFERSVLKIYDLVFASAVDKILREIVNSPMFDIEVFDRLILSNKISAYEYLDLACTDMTGGLAAKSMTDILNSDSLKDIAKELYGEDFCKSALSNPEEATEFQKALQKAAILAFIRIVLVEQVVKGLLVFSLYNIEELIKNNDVFIALMLGMIEKNANMFPGDYYSIIEDGCFDLMVQDIMGKSGQLTASEVPEGITVAGKRLIYKNYGNKKTDILHELTEISKDIYNLKFILKTKGGRTYLPKMKKLALHYITKKQINEILGPLSEVFEKPIKNKKELKYAFLATDKYMEVPLQSIDFETFYGNGLDTSLPYRWFNLSLGKDAGSFKNLLAQNYRTGPLADINIDAWLAVLDPGKIVDAGKSEMENNFPDVAPGSHSYMTDLFRRMFTPRLDGSNCSNFYFPKYNWGTPEGEQRDHYNPADFDQDMASFTPLGKKTRNGGFVIQRYLRVIPKQKPQATKWESQNKFKQAFRTCFNFGFDGGVRFGHDTDWFTADNDFAVAFSPQAYDMFYKTINYHNNKRSSYYDLLNGQNGEGMLININSLEFALLNSLYGVMANTQAEEYNWSASGAGGSLLDLTANKDGFFEFWPFGGQSLPTNPAALGIIKDDLLNSIKGLNLEPQDTVKLSDFFEDIKIGHRLVYVFPHSMNVHVGGPYKGLDETELEELMEKDENRGNILLSEVAERFKINMDYLVEDISDGQWILDTTSQSRDMQKITDAAPSFVEGSFAGILADTITDTNVSNSLNDVSSKEFADSFIKKCFTQRSFRTTEMVFENIKPEDALVTDGSTPVLTETTVLKRIYSLPIGDAEEYSLFEYPTGDLDTEIADVTLNDIIEYYRPTFKPDSKAYSSTFLFNGRGLISDFLERNKNLLGDRLDKKIIEGKGNASVAGTSADDISSPSLSSLVGTYIFPDSVIKTLALMHVINFPTNKTLLSPDKFFSVTKEAAITTLDSGQIPKNDSFVLAQRFDEKGGVASSFKEELDKLTGSDADNPIVAYFQKLTPRLIIRAMLEMTDVTWNKAFSIQKEAGSTEKQLFSEIVPSLRSVPIFPLPPFGITPPTKEELQDWQVITSEDETQAITEYSIFLNSFWPFGNPSHPISGLGILYWLIGYVAPFSETAGPDPDLDILTQAGTDLKDLGLGTPDDCISLPGSEEEYQEWQEKGHFKKLEEE